MALKIPHGLDERAVEHFALGKDDDIGALAAAVKIAREEVKRLADLETVSLADKSQTAEAALLAVSNAARTSAKRVATQLDAARGRVQAALAAIDKRISSPPPPRDASAMQIESEIRARLASMPDKERDAAVAQAFAEKDEKIIGAVLRGPAMLVGVGPAKHNVWRNRYATEFHRDEYERRTRLAKALEATDRSGNLFVGVIKQATDSPAARLAEANRQKREEALAAHQQG